eukprot:maker-scaffold886_size84816-snap-gene-0.26 protein:Tk01970 transcript:maker-scaffold886_size84816-snap-gene-0.26-mRNA-1 annotation:"hypothetical protein HELRODRAFT_74437"
MASLKADLDQYLKAGSGTTRSGLGAGLGLAQLSQSFRLPTLKSPFASSSGPADDNELLLEEGTFGRSSSGTPTSKGGAWLAEAQKDCCPSLSQRQRITGFMLCLGMGVLCFTLASLYAPLLVLYARKFALLFSLGSVFTLGSFSMLWGPVRHFQHLTSPARLPFTGIYLLTLAGTLYFSMGMQNTVLTVVAATGQILALVWFLVSYIPGGQAGLNFFSKMCSSLCRSTAPSMAVPQVRAAGFVLYRLQGSTVEFLLLQTSYGQNHWTPPKGHVDPGESDHETALRETQEEAGIREGDMEVVPDFKAELNYPVKSYKSGQCQDKVVTYWLARVKEGANITLSEEHCAFKWLPLAEACQLCGFKDMEELLHNCQNHLAHN